MTETQSYAIEVINIVPDNSLCLIQAPSIEDRSKLHQLLIPSPIDYYKQTILTPLNKNILIEIIKNEAVEGFFHSMEIWYDNKLCFEGWNAVWTNF